VLERRGAEVLVERVRAGQQLEEAVHPDGNGDRQADRRPERVTAADQSQNSNMFAGSMPNAATASAFADRPTKCRDTTAASG